ncbi:MAG: lysophospholipid acyltransferase family protein [Kiritimatiellae bacterium]|nr:lysophospholipid acyltransferase family protein [Kiritimatiellia bacterium]
MSRKKRKSKFAHLCEYAALRGACALVNAIPYPVACMLARWAAAFAFNVLRVKNERTLTRIRSVFPGIAAAEARRIAVFSLANLFITGVEMIRAPRLDKAWITRHVDDIEMYSARLRGYIEEGRGVVIMVPHAGNWYMAAWAMAHYGAKLFSIAARQRNPYVNAWMNRQYGDGVKVLERGSASSMHEIKGRLLRGEAFAILPDLRVMVKDVEVPFLNGTANVSHGGALFAVHTGAPVVVAMMRRINGRHVFDHLGTLRPDPNAADRRAEACRLTSEAMKLIDAAVKKTPEQWFWFNKRWILEPVHDNT